MKKSSARFRFFAASLLLSALVFVIPALKDGNATLYLLAAAVPCAMLLLGTVIPRMFSLDRMIISLVLWLCAAGIAALARTDPDAALTQALRCGAGMAALIVGGVLIRSLTPSLLTSSCAAFLGLLLLTGRLLSPALALPLAEVSIPLLLIAFAALFARQGPVPALAVGIAGLALLLVQGETAEAVFWGLAVLLLAFAADGRAAVVLPALAVMGALFFVTFTLFPLPREPQDAGMLHTLVSAGPVGADPLPEAFTALKAGSLFPLMTGSFGLIFAGLTALLFLPLALRGTTVAACARLRFHAVLAMGASLLLSFRALAALLAVFGFLPFGSLSLPFLTDSLPALCGELFLAGLLCGVSGRNEADLAEDAHLAMLAK